MASTATHGRRTRRTKLRDIGFTIGIVAAPVCRPSASAVRGRWSARRIFAQRRPTDNEPADCGPRTTAPGPRPGRRRESTDSTAVVTHELHRLPAIGAVRDHHAVRPEEGDRRVRRRATTARTVLHDQLPAFRADRVRVARPRVRADVRRQIRLASERLHGRQRLDEPAMRDGLVERVRGADVGLERLALDVLDETPARVRVREDRDGEVPLGHDLEQQDVPA